MRLGHYPVRNNQGRGIGDSQTAKEREIVPPVAARFLSISIRDIHTFAFLAISVAHALPLTREDAMESVSDNPPLKA